MGARNAGSCSMRRRRELQHAKGFPDMQGVHTFCSRPLLLPPRIYELGAKAACLNHLPFHGQCRRPLEHILLDCTIAIAVTTAFI
jgi:hypothetical protein